jgi:hypothetical protein
MVKGFAHLGCSIAWHRTLCHAEIDISKWYVDNRRPANGKDESLPSSGSLGIGFVGVQPIQSL